MQTDRIRINVLKCGNMDGKKLKAIREKLGYSRKDIAQVALVTEYEVQSWEEGWYIMQPSSGEIESMAELFDITEEELCTLLNIEDYDKSEPKFIDYIDVGLRAIKHMKNRIERT